MTSRRILASVAFGSVIFVFFLIFLQGDRTTQFGDFGIMYVQMTDVISTKYSTFEFQYRGRDIDPTLEFVPFRKPFLGIVRGSAYIDFPPYFPAVAAPFYQILGTGGMYIPGFISVIGVIFLLIRIGRVCGLNSGAIAFAIPLYLLGTRVLLYNIVFHEYPIAIFLSTLSIYLLLRYADRGAAIDLILFGFVSALALYFRLEVIFVTIGFALAVLFADRAWFRIPGFSILGFFLPFCILMGLNQYIHGHPLGLRFALTLDDSASLSRLYIIQETLFSKLRGLVPQSPFLLLAFVVGLIEKKRTIRIAWVGLCVSAILILLTSPNHGDHMAPRYLFGLFPLAVILSLKSIDGFRKFGNWPQRVALVILILLSGYSVRQTWSAFAFYAQVTEEVRSLNAFASKHAEDVLVLREYALALNLQNSFGSRKVFLADSEHSISRLQRLLRERGVSSFTVVGKNPEMPGQGMEHCGGQRVDFQPDGFVAARVCTAGKIYVAQMTRPQ
ncbi:MAG: glycosyltransferase family 39 protein [Leptospirales bacterium]|nr:glycosyltransferase family 39 protein [Leptospirales bacterium]